jgi:hypothetical protein
LTVHAEAAGADLDIEELPCAALLPYYKAGFANGFSVQHDLGRADGSGLCEVTRADRDSLDRLGAVDQHGFSHRDDKVVCGVFRRDACGRGRWDWSLGLKSQLACDCNGKRAQQSNWNPDSRFHCFSSPTANFCSLCFDPL